VELIAEVVQNNPLFSKEEIDYYILHQPNKFILKRMGEKLGVTDGQLFDNIVELFGNSNGSSIPLCITYNLSEQLKQKSLKLCISGFGVGLSWNVLLMQMGQLLFCDIIEYP
jgi:3-oxoacyl-[acyl-carrier-protein] synthase-3